jgi:hypothetical protein
MPMKDQNDLTRSVEQSQLRQLDFLVKRSQLSADAPPFLGLALEADKLPKAQKALQALSDWKLQKLFESFGYVCSWAICAFLSEHYGEEGAPKVWPFIEDLFGRDFSSNEARQTVFREFIKRCRKLGLASDGFERPVQAFLIHAGVSRTQLHHLARAFVAQERSLGLPDLDDIVKLNRWEDDALHYLSMGVEVPRMPILMDHSAWMAAAYVDWRNNAGVFSDKSNYLQAFGEQLEKALAANSGTSIRLAPTPRLIWEDARPQLLIPGQAQRFKLLVDGETHRVRAGRLWPLPFPLPSEVSWEGEAPGSIPLFRAEDYLVFDSNTGRRVDTTKRQIDGQTRIAGIVATAVVAAREAFNVDDQPASEVGPGLFAAEVDLRSGKVTLNRGKNISLLVGARRPQISIRSLPIAKGLGVPNLWGPEAEVELDFGSGELPANTIDPLKRLAFIKVAVADQEAVLDAPTDGRGVATITVLDLIGSFGLSETSGPFSITLTLLRSIPGQSEQLPTRFKRRFFVWPGFERQEALTLVANKSPENFVETESQHVFLDKQGLFFDRSGGYTDARMAFEIDGNIALFSVRPSVLSAVLERADGTVLPWLLGDTIVKGAATHSDALVITSPDRGASLKVGARRISEPFRDRPTWAIPIGSLDGGDIVHLSSQGLPTVLATVEGATEPRSLAIRSWIGGGKITLEMPFAIGGVLATLETEDGKIDRCEISFDHIPSERPSQFWVKASEAVGQKIMFQIDAGALAGLSLVSLRLRKMGSSEWFQLSNARNDRFAFPLIGAETRNTSTTILSNVNRWLMKCYAPEAWEADLGNALVGRWAELIRAISQQPGGYSSLLLIAIRDEGFDWLPMVHVLQEVPDIFSGPAINFHSFSSASGSERILRVIADTETTRVRDLQLNPLAFGGFKNAANASRTGERLIGFSPERLAKIITNIAVRPKEWLSTDALGPDHAMSAVSLLRDRIEAFQVLGAGDGEGRMSLRSVQLNRVASALRDLKLAERCLSKNDEDDSSARMIEEALVAFAIASRTGPTSVRQMIERVSHNLGLERRLVLASIGEMVRLGQELFMFHLIAAELEKRTKP